MEPAGKTVLRHHLIGLAIWILAGLDFECAQSFILWAMETLTVKEAADFAGLTAHTLRYYERVGLIQPVARNAGGHRRYAQTDLELLESHKREVRARIHELEDKLAIIEAKIKRFHELS